MLHVDTYYMLGCVLNIYDCNCKYVNCKTQVWSAYFMLNKLKINLNKDLVVTKLQSNYLDMGFYFTLLLLYFLSYDTHGLSENIWLLTWLPENGKSFFYYITRMSCKYIFIHSIAQLSMKYQLIIIYQAD